jgi:hypothetical protein
MHIASSRRSSFSRRTVPRLPCWKREAVRSADDGRIAGLWRDLAKSKITAELGEKNQPSSVYVLEVPA